MIRAASGSNPANRAIRTGPAGMTSTGRSSSFSRAHGSPRCSPSAASPRAIRRLQAQRAPHQVEHARDHGGDQPRDLLAAGPHPLVHVDRVGQRQGRLRGVAGGGEREREVAQDPRAQLRVAGVEQLRGEVEVPGRRDGFARRGRDLRGRQRVGDAACRPGQVGGGEVLARDLGRQLGAAVALERLGQATVHARAPARREPRVQRTAHQRAGEVVAVVVEHAQELGLQRLVQAVEQLRLVVRRHGLELTESEPLLEHRGELEHRLGRLGQLGQPQPDRAPDRHGRAPGRILSPQLPRELLGEERVPAALGVDRVEHVRPDARLGGALDQHHGLVRRHALQADVEALAPPGDRRQRRGLDLAAAVQHDDQRCGSEARDVHEQLDRLGGRPLQVVEHDHRAAVEGGGDRVVVARVRTPSESLGPRRVGRADPARIARPPQHLRARSPGELTRKPCLADARLAVHHHHGPLLGLEGIMQAGQLILSPDEIGDRRGHRQDGACTRRHQRRS